MSHNQFTFSLSKGKINLFFPPKWVYFTWNFSIHLSLLLGNENLEQDIGKCSLLYHCNPIGPYRTNHLRYKQHKHFSILFKTSGKTNVKWRKVCLILKETHFVTHFILLFKKLFLYNFLVTVIIYILEGDVCKQPTVAKKCNSCSALTSLSSCFSWYTPRGNFD